MEKKLGDNLVEEGLISPSQLELALQEHSRTGKSLSATLIALGFVSETAIATRLAKSAETELVNLATAEITLTALETIPYEMAKKFKVLPITLEHNQLKVAMADIYNVVAIDTLEKKCGLAIQAVAAAESELLEALENNYIREASISDTVDQIMQQQEISDDEDSPLTRLSEQIITLGIRSFATDIHIEPEETALRIRMRRDGIMHEESLMPAKLKSSLTTRIKIMAELDITEKRVPQDGRIRFNFGNRHVDLRVSTLPTQYGESIVLRILDASSASYALQTIGFSPKALQQYQSALSIPHGIILVTGPTGSGKTTTLYASMAEIDTKQRSVFTLEDPIEYSMNNIRQVQIRDDVGMSFAAGLRALLRQDPDVILVGEIRDAETASLAVRAALTGHAVFSTLHTNDAVGAIPRLIDMGIEPYLIPSALAAIVAQRLVRVLCPKCKVEMHDTAINFEELGIPKPAENFTLWKPVGCDTCNQTGYKGRQAIYEVLLINDSFHDAIVDSANRKEILALAKTNGMQTMLEDGFSKATQGVTSFEEVLRVVK
ncbi:MAG: ATPase, T2SS/T4P/T4SS family [Ghiorsea sp.]